MGVNPIRRTREILGTIAINPSEEHDPEWERIGTLARWKRRLTLYPFLTVAVVFFVIALTIFFVPVLPSAHRSGVTLGIGFYVISVAVSNWKGRTSAFKKLGEFDLNIKFTGRGISARLGKKDERIDDRMIGFKKLREFSHGGLKTAFEEFRDRYSRNEISNHKEKHHRAESDGSGHVRHGLLDGITFETGTCEYGIDLFNTVSVTHAGAEDERLESKKMETASVLPPVLDTRTSAKVEGAFRAEKQSRSQADQELSLAKDQLDRLEEYVDPAGQTLFERTVELVDRERERRNQDRRQDRTTNNASNGGER